MFKAKVKKQNQVTNQGEFKTLAEAQEWIQSCEAVEAFGPTAKDAITEKVQVLIKEEVQEVRDAETDEILVPYEPAVYEEQEIIVQPEVKQEYIVEIEDITQQVALEKSKQEEKRLAKEKRKADRKAVDVSKITTVKALIPVIENLISTIEELEKRLG